MYKGRNKSTKKNREYHGEFIISKQKAQNVKYLDKRRFWYAQWFAGYYELAERQFPNKNKFSNIIHIALLPHLPGL